MLALSACEAEVDGDPLYSGPSCRRVGLVDAETGDPIIGAEDLAFDREASRVLISAYDRRAVERQAAKRAIDLDEGGIYAAPLAALAGAQTKLSLSSIVARETVAGGLRPHGISFDPESREISFVNRSYQKIHNRWRMTARIERAGADGAVFVGDGGAPRCSANDLATFGERTLVTFDHSSCGWRGVFEDLIGARKSGVDSMDGGEAFAGARHANGVAAIGGDSLALAATRDMTLLMLGAAGDGFAVERKIALPGAPDNLTLSGSGMLIAALHPSLAAIGAQRRLGVGRAGSRVVRVDPATGEQTLLFEDPEARLFSAASAAIEEDGVLVIGSTLDRGLLVCNRSDAAS